MCIISVCKAGVPLPDTSTMGRCWNRNPDGAGIMWRVPGQPPRMLAGIMSPQGLADALADLPGDPTTYDVAIHWRIGTAGPNDATNCHPWRIHDGLFMMHNGILPLELPKTWKLSDTAMLAHMLGVYGMRSGGQALHDPAFRVLFDTLESDYNKLVFMDSKGITIHAAHLGSWDDEGRWWSNTGYMTTAGFWASDPRRASRSRSASDWTDDEFADYLIDRYGDDGDTKSDRDTDSAPMETCAICGWHDTADTMYETETGVVICDQCAVLWDDSTDGHLTPIEVPVGSLWEDD